MNEAVKKEKKKMSVKAKIIMIVGIVLAAILLILFAVRLYFRLPAWDYYRASEKGFKIPGLSDGFVPQGMDYDGVGYFWVTGYMSDGSASPVYVVKKETGELFRTLYLAYEDGSAYCGHAGGIAVNCEWEYVYVAGGKENCVLAYKTEDLIQAEDGESVKAAGRISTKVSEEDYLQPACVYLDMDRGNLFVLEFYKDPEYPTPANHKLTTPAGDQNQALAAVFKLDGEADFGVKSELGFALSLPDRVQGMCIDKESIYLSTSWGTSFSKIYEYGTGVQATSTITLLGQKIPLYCLDSASLEHTYKLPPMSEEIVVVDGKLYTMCESAANKYMFGKLTSSQWCYKTDLAKMKK